MSANKGDQMSMSSVEDWVMLRIWKRVEPSMTKRKMPSSQGPTCEPSSFFCLKRSLPAHAGSCRDWRFCASRS
jgi:hypothetical protein